MFDWLFKKPSIRKFPDSFSLTKQGMLLGLRDSINNQFHDNRFILLVCHFQDRFLEIERTLNDFEFDFEILTDPVSDQFVSSRWKETSGFKKTVFLTFPQFLVPQNEPVPISIQENLSIAIMVCERHPLHANDEHLINYAKSLTYPVEMGFFASLEDAVMQLFVTDELITLLKQMGLTDHELITSNLITKRMRSGLNKLNVRQPIQHVVTSAKEWLHANTE